MRKRLALYWIVPAVLALLGGCHKSSGESAYTQQLGPVTVHFRTDPQPPRVGQPTRFVVGLVGAHGAVTGATVSLQLATPTGQVTPGGLAAEAPPGRYTVAGTTMGEVGDWEARVQVMEPSVGEVTAKFPVKVAK